MVVGKGEPRNAAVSDPMPLTSSDDHVG